MEELIVHCYTLPLDMTLEERFRVTLTVRWLIKAFFIANAETNYSPLYPPTQYDLGGRFKVVSLVI